MKNDPENDEKIEALLDDLADSVPVPQSFLDRDMVAWCIAEAERRGITLPTPLQRQDPEEATSEVDKAPDVTSTHPRVDTRRAWVIRKALPISLATGSLAALIAVAILATWPGRSESELASTQRFTLTPSDNGQRTRSASDTTWFSGDKFDLNVVISTKLKHGWVYVISKDSAGLIGRFAPREDGSMEVRFSSHFDADPCHEYFVAILSETDVPALNEKGTQPSWIPKPLYEELQRLGDQSVPNADVANKIERLLRDAGITGAVYVDVKRFEHLAR